MIARKLREKIHTAGQWSFSASGSIMMLSVVAVALPAAYQGAKEKGSTSSVQQQWHATKEEAVAAAAAQDVDTASGILFISRGTAIILLVVYALYLVFQLKTHSFLYEGEEGDDHGNSADEDEEEAEVPMMTPVAAVISLGIITVVTSFSADYLVSAIDETAQDYSIPKAFISTILLPIVGNAAEHVTSCVMAYKGKMEIALGVAIGSSSQISMGLLPILVIVGWIIGQPLTLYFQTFETVILVSAVILVNSLIQDGRSNYMEGIMLFALYCIAALGFWVSPAGE
jgi:Ca2+:H+ antiporter